MSPARGTVANSIHSRSLCFTTTRVPIPRSTWTSKTSSPSSSRIPLRSIVPRASSPEGEPTPAAAPTPAAVGEETTFYEGSGSNIELAINILLGFTLLYLPLTMQAVGRRAWIKYKFTNKRVIVTTNSPALKREVQVEYSKIKEIRTVPRAFGAWGDCVIFLKDGSRLEMVGLENFDAIRNHVEQFITD